MSALENLHTTLQAAVSEAMRSGEVTGAQIIGALESVKLAFGYSVHEAANRKEEEPKP